MQVFPEEIESNHIAENMTKTCVQEKAGKNRPGPYHDIHWDQSEGRNQAWISRADDKQYYVDPYKQPYRV